MRTYKPEEVSLHQEESGYIRSWWASVPGHLTRCVGHVDDTTREEAVARAVRAAEGSDAWAVVEAQLRADFPNRQIFKGTPEMARDVEWPAGYPVNREYLYVLKDRRRNGKYQLLAAYTI